ncbi:MAG TPA: VOC family protein [Candidatus Polarisedimenticolaceae bacterium]|nr:VOC family protein [Candidatus Polarisedimenticolaceae bacterium]
MIITPYLSFDGQCKAALTFYERCLGATIVYSMTYGESPGAADLSPEWGPRIYHATLSVRGQTIGVADAPPGSYRQPQGFSLMLEIDEPAEADRVFELLAEGGDVQMPIQETHWAARFGVVTDRFGTPWFVNCGRP